MDRVTPNRPQGPPSVDRVRISVNSAVSVARRPVGNISGICAVLNSTHTSATHGVPHTHRPRTQAAPDQTHTDVINVSSVTPLTRHVPCATTFPGTLNAKLLVSAPHPVTLRLHTRVKQFVSRCRRILSQFHTSSLITHVNGTRRNKRFSFPS